MASSPIVPKEQLSAYQRWELGSFDQPKAHAATVESIERAKQADAHARNEGFRAGHREGLEAGRREARAEAAPSIARLNELVSALEADLKRVDTELAEQVVELGLAVARKLVGTSLQARPESVKDSVEDALRHVVQAQGIVNVIVNPEDAAIVRSHLEVSPNAGTWALKEDPKVARGGCRIETGSGEIDATIGHRWERITAALGEPQKWIE
jgi:flagellar assembly protein FliH